MTPVLDASVFIYDAVYVALALMADTPLLTLDAEVVERCSAHFAELRVLRA